MRITAIRDLQVPLSGAVANAVVSFNDHNVSLLAVQSDQQRNGKAVVGFAFNSIGRFAQSGILRNRMIPRVLAAPADTLLHGSGRAFDPAAVAAAAMRNEKPGGHGDRAGAVAALELAIWDLNAKLADEPAWHNIARQTQHSPASTSTPVYAAGGYYHAGNSAAGLEAELRGYADQGYHSFKVKIGGASQTDDLRRIEAALTVAQDGQHLAVDANGRFDQRQALAWAEALTPHNLRWFEEPGDPLDYQLHSAVAAAYPGALATGENLFSSADSINLLRYGGMRPQLDIFQMDPGLAYGLSEYMNILAALESRGFTRSQCLPHGGHLINLHIAVGLGLGGCEAYPGVFQPFGGYPAQCPVANGRVSPSDAPGFGLEQKPELQPFLQQLHRPQG